MTEPIDIVYRPDGILVMDHLEDPNQTGELACGQPRWAGVVPPTGEVVPACPKCFQWLVHNDYQFKERA